jgi:hypothetical protein
MWVIILLCATFLLKEIFNVLVGSLCEYLGKDMSSWTHVYPTLSRELV